MNQSATVFRVALDAKFFLTSCLSISNYTKKSHRKSKQSILGPIFS